MIRKTKKELKELHSHKKINLIGAYHRRSKEEIKNALVEIDTNNILTLPLTRIVDMTSSSDGILTTEVYMENIKGQIFYFVETVNNSSMDNQCSWNDIIYSVVLYRLITR